MVIWKNAYFHNVEYLTENEDKSVSWVRVPKYVYDNLRKGEHSKRQASDMTGVEIRFILKGESAKITMSCETEGIFHVYRGSIQGRWQDSIKCVSNTPTEFVIERCEKEERIEEMTKRCGFGFSYDVVRIIFDKGHFKIHNIEGDISVPAKNDFPKKTILTYGSSITQGSNSLGMSYAWPAVLGYNLNMDVRNLGMAGCCIMEDEFVDYIASEGEKANWDIAVLELGINLLAWEKEKMIDRSTNIIKEVAKRNKDKKIFVISPFYHCLDDFGDDKKGDLWREVLKDVTNELNFENVTYINGLDVLDNMSYMSADYVHPNIYGVSKIAQILTEKIKEIIKE